MLTKFFHASTQQRLALLIGAGLSLGLSAQANTISVKYVGADTGVTNGADFVLPYQLDVNGITMNATCYDIFHDVTPGETWTANELTVAQAAATGQFSGSSNALAKYEDVGFLSQQTTSSAQNQIDLQQDIWNIFAPHTYTVTTGMQTYLNLLTTTAFTNFNFQTVRFLEDVNQGGSGQAQAFVIDPPAATPEPGTVVLLGSGFLLIGIGRIRKLRNRTV